MSGPLYANAKEKSDVAFSTSLFGKMIFRVLNSAPLTDSGAGRGSGGKALQGAEDLTCPTQGQLIVISAPDL